MAEIWLTTAAVARMFDVNRSTVTRWARLDQIPYVKTPGGTYRFRRQDVERFLEGQGRTTVRGKAD